MDDYQRICQGASKKITEEKKEIYIYTHTTPQREKERAGSELASERFTQNLKTHAIIECHAASKLLDY